MFNVDKFTSNLNETGGLAQGYSFIVDIIPPAKLQTSTNVNLSHLSFRCSAAEMPGREINQTSMITPHGERKFSTGSNYIRMNTEIILSSNLQEREYFLEWQDIAIGNHRKKGNADKKKGAFNVGYYSDYVGTVVIKHLDISAESSEDWLYKMTLIEAYPAAVRLLARSWDDTEIIKMAVEWEFKLFEDEWRAGTNVSKEFKPPKQNLNLASLSSNIPSIIPNKLELPLGLTPLAKTAEGAVRNTVKSQIIKKTKLPFL